MHLYDKENELVMLKDVLISVLDTADGQVNGRTALQKLCYFVSVEIGKDLGYIAHYYGPYSPSVAFTAKELSGLDFIDERGIITSNDRLVYSYRLTHDGQSLANEIRRRSRKLYEHVNKVVDICTKVTGNNADILSWAAKVHYILIQKRGKVTYKEVMTVGKSFGWKLSKQEIDSGVQLLKALSLVKTK